MVIKALLQEIMPGATDAHLTEYLGDLNSAMAEFEITTTLRVAAFLAQLAEESGELRYMEEIWGPSAAQKLYDPPGPKAKELGNTVKGDGPLFRGRGPLQITGRANYGLYGQRLGLNLLTNPELAATSAVGFRIAGSFWTCHGLNTLADEENFVDITRRINGGLNGLTDRETYYRRALHVLGSGAAP